MSFLSAAVCLCVLVSSLQATSQKYVPKVMPEDLEGKMERFTHPGVTHFSELLFDIQGYQLIVGARDYLFRLSLEGLRKLEEVHWPAVPVSVKSCMQKGQTKENCKNFIKVLWSYNKRIFACGTNAFSPSCSWRDINSLSSLHEQVDGVGKAPYSPHFNSTSLMTVQGDYYIASALDFSARDHAIFKIMGRSPYLRTVQYDPRWLNEPNFVASFEIGSFVYIFFREAAVEYMNCGKIVYSRVARVCKNDQGGQHTLKDNWTTFLKARLNCSLPGSYPFYYNEIQSVHYLEREEIIYATFTTPENSIYGSAVCAFNMSAIANAFNGPLKYQANPKATWEKASISHKHFQCGGSDNSFQLPGSKIYQLTDESVSGVHLHPFYTAELERLHHIVVDVVPTKYSDGIHVIFAATLEGTIKKMVVVPRSHQTCLIEEINPFSPGKHKILSLKLLKDTSSLYVGTDKEVLRIPLHRCEQYKTESSCLGSMDPYCGWNLHQLTCTTAPHRNPLSSAWTQENTVCPVLPVEGGWSPWSNWSDCNQVGKYRPGDHCLCRSRSCTNPSPMNGGKDCEGTTLEVTNCTQNGQWTEWSAWSACSQTCGLAMKTRKRSCGNPAPAHGGRLCLGSEREETYCTNIPPCPVESVGPIDGQWSEWSQWGECNSQCGGGFRKRTRKCNNPPPQNNGRYCRGCDQEYSTCNMQQCPEYRKSSDWTSWIFINQTRDGYFEQRFRFTCKANVPDSSSLKVGNIKKEARYCFESENKGCMNSDLLSVDGEWSDWSEWSPCSEPCGGGKQFRERSCDNPRPVGTGADCQGKAREERECNIHVCQPLEGWNEWTVWSLCDQNHEQHRQRICKLPDPDLTICRGSSKETRLCIPEQEGMQKLREVKQKSDDGITLAHLMAACVCGIIIGLIAGSLVMYFYMKKKLISNPKHLAMPLVQAESNTYVPPPQYKNNFNTLKNSPVKLQREATIKRNGHFRAQIHSDQNF